MYTNKKKFKILLVISSFMFASCFPKKEIPMIGLDSNGNEKILYIPYKGYRNKAANLLNEYSEETIFALSSSQTEYPSWELKKFFVGIGVSGSVGIPNVFALEGSSTISLYFEKI